MPVTARVRPARDDDRGFIVGLVPRLRAFGPPPLRPTDALDRAERAALERALENRRDDQLLVVAEGENGAPLGVALAEVVRDYFTDEDHAHLAIIAVAAEAEGQGAGRALLDAVEGWSRGLGHRFVTLNVFAGNARARDVYERAGYAPDTLRYVKTFSMESP